MPTFAQDGCKFGQITADRKDSLSFLKPATIALSTVVSG